MYFSEIVLVVNLVGIGTSYKLIAHTPINWQLQVLYIYSAKNNLYITQ